MECSAPPVLGADLPFTVTCSSATSQSSRPRPKKRGSFEPLFRKASFESRRISEVEPGRDRNIPESVLSGGLRHGVHEIGNLDLDEDVVEV